MIYLRFFLLIQLIAGFCACEKPPPSIVDVPILPEDTLVVPPPPVDSHIIGLGNVRVFKNGQIWDVPFIAGFSNLEGTFSIIGKKLFPNGVLQSFSIGDIPCKPGKFDLEFWPSPASLYPNRIPSAHFGMLYDGDQFIGSFLLDSLRNDHYIEVLEYDTLTNIAEGRFQVFLNRNYTGGWQPSGIYIPDTMAMTEGKFRLEVKQY